MSNTEHSTADSISFQYSNMCYDQMNWEHHSLVERWTSGSVCHLTLKAFRWRADNYPLLVVFGSSLPLSNKKYKKTLFIGVQVVLLAIVHGSDSYFCFEYLISTALCGTFLEDINN